MKTLLFFALAFMAAGIVTAQEEAVELEDITVRSKNSNFLHAMQDDYTPNHAITMQNKAASYDLIHSEHFRGSKKCDYFIEFKSEKGSMYTTYDRKGEITRCKENYKNIALPVEVRDEILKDNLGWELKGSEYSTLYKDGEVFKKVYKVYLIKGKEKKIMIIDIS